MTKKQKLELTWIGKENRPKLEPRILLEDPTLSYHARHRVASADLFDNRLIFGDNLLALKALEGEFSGKVKCVFIDPPYNTGSAFTHYDDGVEHSIWLSLMRDRLEILWRLLEGNGSLWVSIDDSEMPYLRVLLDEVCGRRNFVASNVWQKRYSRENREAIGDAHEYVLVYAKDPDQFKCTRNKLPLGEKQLAVYKNRNNDPNGAWRAVSFSAQGFRPNQMYEIVSPITGKRHRPPEGSCWKVIESEYLRLLAAGRMFFGKNGDAVPSRIQYLKDIEGIVPWTWWPHEEVGHTDESKREIQTLFGKSDTFDTPKPERLVNRILEIATNLGDLVLDSFAGSGTTGAVAHKMGRRWVINHDYNAAMLAEAVAKMEGFTYAPSDAVYWQHGHSTERDFVYVTTASLTHEQLQQLADEVGPERSLLVLCTAFRAKADAYPNLTVKKIPKQVLSRCEWGHDDYSLQVENLPLAPSPPAPLPEGEGRNAESLTPTLSREGSKAGQTGATPDLFGDGGGHSA